jgi:virulence factor Mce-like protein
MAVGGAALLVIAVVAYFLVSGTPTKTITAEFPSAPGLYVGNQVDVLGIPKGHIDSVTPGPNYVTVKMSVDKSLMIPANVTAELIAPEVVSDRAVQLDPPYQGGAQLAPGAVIPLDHTVIPVSVDDVVGQLNQLVTDLGPNGANKNGALTSLLQEVAKQFAGNGPNINHAIVSMSKVFQGLAQTSPQLASLLNQLGSLSQALGTNSGTYTQFASSLNDVSGLLATDRTQIGDVLSNLQQLLGNLTHFIDTNQAALGSSVVNLDVFAQTLVNEQTQLAKVFELTPLSIQNLNAAIDLQAPGGPALRARFNPLPDTTQAFNGVCGNAVLHFLVILATGTQTNPLTPGTPMDSVCALGNALGALTPPPNSAQGPDLSLASLVPGS